MSNSRFTIHESGLHGKLTAAAALGTAPRVEHVFLCGPEAMTRDLETHVVDMRVDDDQDAIWLRVDVGGGASCHVGYRSCFYRSVPLGAFPGTEDVLVFKESTKVFDPTAVYGDAPNPTQL